MKCSGDFEIVHAIVCDTTRIVHDFPIFVKYHELIRVVQYLGFPTTSHIFSSLNYQFHRYVSYYSGECVFIMTKLESDSAGILVGQSLS